VIPTFARPEGLRACLDGLGRSTFDLGCAEIIVVDDGGGHAAVEDVAREFAAWLPVRTAMKANGGPASARNHGAFIARGRYLAFIDDDCVPAPDWLTHIVAALEENPGAVVGGPVINGLPDDPFADASQRIATYVARHYAQGKGREKFFTTNNFGLAADRFRELGGFDATIPSWTAEDKEFCDRWRDRGYPMVWTPAARVHHAHALTLSTFVRQHFDYGRGILAFRMRRTIRNGKRIVPESAGFYGGLVFSPLRDKPRAKAVQQVLLLMLSQVATAAGAVATALALAPRPDDAEAAAPQSVAPAKQA
jgi:GT2 family glycosyltransferase